MIDEKPEQEPKRKTKLPVKASRRDLMLSAAFDKHAQKIAENYLLDLQEVRDAYAERPENLKSLYNTMSGAKSGRGENVLWGVLSLLLLPILTPWAGWCFYKNTKKLGWVRENVTKAIADQREKTYAPSPETESDAAEAPAPTKPERPFKMT